MAIMLLLFFSISSTHALALVMPPCAQCPPDCPMHAKKLGCHHGAGAAPATADGPESGLHCAGCTHHADRPVLSDQPVVLSALASVIVAPPGSRGALASFCRPAEAALDPPFHPPRITLTGI
jgi:hypothetical protein